MLNVWNTKRLSWSNVHNSNPECSNLYNMKSISCEIIEIWYRQNVKLMQCETNANWNLDNVKSTKMWNQQNVKSTQCEIFIIIKW